MEPRNNLSWRVTVLEREVQGLKDGQPAVVADRVSRLATEIDSLRRDVNEDLVALKIELRERDKKQSEERAVDRKILIGFFVSVALIGIGVALSFVLSGGTAGVAG